MRLKNDKIKYSSIFKRAFQISICIILLASVSTASAIFIDPDFFYDPIGYLFGPWDTDTPPDGGDGGDGGDDGSGPTQVFNINNFPVEMGREGAAAVTSYQVTPEVIMPKETGVITVTIENTGGESIDVKDVILHSRDIRSLSDNYKAIGTLGPGTGTTLLFKFRAPDKEGVYFPEIWIGVIEPNSTTSRTIKYPILINVNTDISTIKEPALEVEKILPDYIKAGYSYVFTLKLTNKGLGRANDVKVLIVTDSSIPISMTSPNNYYIDGIEPGESYSLQIEFVSDKNADLGLFTIPVAIEYNGVNGITKQQGEAVGVQIKGGPEISIASISHDPAKIVKGDFVTLVIKVENTGTGEAKSAKANINLPVDGVKGVFLGKIEPDENVPAVFTFDATETGRHLYSVTIEYEDDGMDKEFSQSSELVVNEPEGIISAVLIELLLPIIFAGMVIGPTIVYKRITSMKEE
ncbi:MAG: hypothetical protein SVM80_02575 [Halobacteriota archaeon]|nr:hypothetical protein [Halobacteriota archaeon]